MLILNRVKTNQGFHEWYGILLCLYMMRFCMDLSEHSRLTSVRHRNTGITQTRVQLGCESPGKRSQKSKRQLSNTSVPSFTESRTFLLLCDRDLNALGSFPPTNSTMVSLNFKSRPSAFQNQIYIEKKRENTCQLCFTETILYTFTASSCGDLSGIT